MFKYAKGVFQEGFSGFPWYFGRMHVVFFFWKLSFSPSTWIVNLKYLHDGVVLKG